jgi:uncharacterized repeat protein (TIGR01451 family)
MSPVVNAEMRMSDGVPGRSSRSRLAGRVALLLGFLVLAAGPAVPLVSAADTLTVTTPFPAVVAEPGTTATFKLAVGVTTAGRVDLTTTGVPSGWTVRFLGGGLVVDGAYVDPKVATDLSLSVEVPQGTAAGTTTITVQASSGSLTATLPLSLRVADAAAGSVTLTSDFPELRGPSSSAFTFNITVHNDTAAEATFSMDATGPAGWTVTAKPAGQAQATSATVAAGSTGGITVSATPPADVAAGTFPVQVSVTGGGKTATTPLQVVITGVYTMTVSTPDQVLSTTANAGSEKSFQLTFTNTGTAPITNVKPSASAPTSWKVTFDPPTIASLDPKTPVTVTALITPTSDAIAGDYVVTMTATGAEANGSTDIRVRVETPQFWWIVGVVLIAGTFAGLYWVFRTYGRR